MLDFPEPKFDISNSCLGGVEACFFDHCRRHVDADHPATWSHLACGKKGVEAGARSQIEDNFTGS
jgi:hypothetical protein